MPPTETLQALATFIESDSPLGIAVVAQGTGEAAGPDAETLSLSDDAADFFRGVLRRAIASSVRADKWQLRPFDPLYKPDAHEVEHLELAEAPAVAMATGHYGNLAPLPEFTGDDDFVKRLRYYVAVLGAPGGEQAFFFRSFTQSSELKRKRGAALMRRDAEFGVVEDRIFLFDDAVDCVVFKGTIFVIRKSDYRRIFDQFDVLRQKAREAAESLNARVPIADFEGFREACETQTTMADKMVAVSTRQYFPTLTVEVLEPVIDEFSIDLDIVEEDGQKHLRFQRDASHRWLILKLLDDDYLRSTMTDNLYEANSKLPRGA
jgi:hypothetical protein